MILVNLPDIKFIAFICSKTGSTTLRTLLLKYFNYKKIHINDYNGEEGCYEFTNRTCEYLDFFDHCSPLDGLKLLENKIDIKLFYKFGFIRKHIDRLISIFKFDKKKEDEQVKLKLEKKLLKDKEKEAYKKLSKEGKLKLREDKKNENKGNSITKYIEFPYLEELNENQYNKLKNNNWVVCDPGMRCLMYMKNKDGVTYKYTNRMHMNKTKRLKYQRLVTNYKDKKEITKIENKLSEFNSKSCILDEFKKFIKNKNELNKVLLEKYKEDIFRKYKWFSYINRKKAETDLARNIKNKFGKDVILIHGDWSDRLKTTPSRIKYISTPNLGLKRKLSEYLTIYNLDEFRTSCLNYKTEERCVNMYLPDKKGIERKIHSILTYQTESKRMGCINRDENAVNNMIKIVNTYLLNKIRPEKFRRDYKFPEKIKDDNPIIISIKNSVKCY